MKNVRSKYKNFYFAMHPQENKISLKKKIIKDLNITLLRNGQEGLEQSDTILGIFSSLMVDAFFENKKVVSIQPKFRTKNLCILSKTKYIGLVSDENELEKYLIGGKIIKNNSKNVFQKSLVGSLKRLELLLDNEKKINIIIQARLQSSRLKKKIMLEINQKPLLFYIIERIKNTRNQ